MQAAPFDREECNERPTQQAEDHERGWSEELVREVYRVASASHGLASPLRLGEYLLMRDLISLAQLEAALAWQHELKQRGRTIRLGELLKDIGAISEDALEKALTGPS